MPHSHVAHLVFMIQPANAGFYKELLTFLGWNVLYEGEGGLGLMDSGGVSLWFMSPAKAVANDYDGPGLNHLALGVPAQSDVDATVDYLKRVEVPTLFDTPRHRPEFTQSETNTYYQVMFVSPDNIQFEVVYTGPKA